MQNGCVFLAYGASPPAADLANKADDGAPFDEQARPHGTAGRDYPRGVGLP